MTTLDVFADQHNIERVLPCKFDMESHELQALAVAQALLAQQRIDAFLIEFQNSTIPVIQQNLRIGNYQLFCIQPSGNLHPCSNSFFLKAFEGNLLALPTQKGNC